jgi:hypothetical protein
LSVFLGEGLRIYFLSERNRDWLYGGERRVTGELTFSLSSRIRERVGSRNGTQESVDFSQNIKTLGLLIMGNRELVLVLRLMIITRMLGSIYSYHL